jgi:MoxR-like ATPase
MKKLLENIFPSYWDMWRILAGRKPKGTRFITTDLMLQKPVHFSKLTQKFANEGEKYLYVPKKQEIFDDIIGYEDVKQIMKNMLSNIHPISILLDGSAGCGKSMFLKQIEKFYPGQTCYIDGSKATKAGIFGVLFDDIDNALRYLLIDEIDKLNTNDQESLLTLIEDGRIVQTQKNGTMEKQYSNLSVIAASNIKEDILGPLQTRFYKIKIKDYTEAQFKEIAASILPQYKLDQIVIEHIIESVWTKKKKPNIRDIRQLGKLCNNSVEMVDLLLENSG